jgi:hypothetical protein
MMDIDFPFSLDGRGRTTAAADDDKHIRDLIEQLLFTSPGERANRPDFGTGLLQLVFQQWLGDLIQVEGVDVVSDEGTLQVTVSYVVRQSQERQVAQFSSGA